MGKKNEKSILEFDFIDEVLEFLKSHDNIKIKVSRSIDYGHGFCQLVDDNEGKGGRKSSEFMGKRTIEELENMAAKRGNELYRVLDEDDLGYDLNKPVYECWIKECYNGYTSKTTLIKILEKAKEDSWWQEDDDEELSSIDAFISDSAGSGISGEEDSLPKAWMKYFDAYDITGGVSNKKGKEIFWGGYWFLEDEDWDIILIT
tara:strand:+ start:56 stop:664 length:609 start_codon:yes stop_codon:yes gene_type:complete